MALANGSLEGIVPLTLVAGNSNALLRVGSASRWASIRNEVHRRYGWWPEVVSAGDGYRTLARQEALFLRNYTTTITGYGPVKLWRGSRWYRKTSGTPSAAVPGQSNHGFGTTVDVDNLGTLGVFSTVRYAQFADVATEFGFSNAEGRSISEPWHWSDTLNPDVTTGAPATPTPSPTPTPAPEDDDMLYTPQEMVRFAKEGAAIALAEAQPGDKQRLADTLRENVGDGGVEGGTGAAWFVKSSDRRMAETLRGNIGDIAAANPSSWWSVAMRTLLAGVDVDEAALAASLVPAVVAALGDDVGLTEEQVQAAAERAMRNVLHNGVG